MIKLEIEVKQIDDNIVICNDKSNITKFTAKELYTLLDTVESKLEDLVESIK